MSLARVEDFMSLARINSLVMRFFRQSRHRISRAQTTGIPSFAAGEMTGAGHPQLYIEGRVPGFNA